MTDPPTRSPAERRGAILNRSGKWMRTRMGHFTGSPIPKRNLGNVFHNQTINLPQGVVGSPKLDFCPANRSLRRSKRRPRPRRGAQKPVAGPRVLGAVLTTGLKSASHVAIGGGQSPVSAFPLALFHRRARSRQRSDPSFSPRFPFSPGSLRRRSPARFGV